MSFAIYLKRFGLATAGLFLAGSMLLAPALADERSALLPVDTSSPRATMQTLQMLIAAMENAIASGTAPKQTQQQQQAEIFRLMQKLTSLLDLSNVSPANRRDTARDAVAFLVDVIRRLDVPPLAEIPGADQFPDVTKPGSWTIPGSEITIGRVMSGPRAGRFLFDPDTVARSREFYSVLKHFPLRVPALIPSWRERQIQIHGWMIPESVINAIPAPLKRPFLDTPIWKILSSLSVLFILGGALVAWARLTRPHETSHTYVSYLRRLLLPLAALLATQAATYINNFQIITIGRYSAFLDLALAIAWFITAAWAAWLVIFAIMEWIIASPQIPDQSLDANLLRLLARILGLLTVAAMVAYGGQELGLPVVGVVAGLGVGGLAVALAAQSSIENLIGGLNLYADRPIRVGDFCDYAGIQGHVEHIGLRSTRLRGLDRTVTSVPNSLLAKVHVTNFALRDQMLYRHTIDLRCETTTAQLRTVVNAITAYLDSNPIVVRNVAVPRVRVIGFGDWSIKVEVYAYVAATQLPAFLVIQQDLTLAIIDIVRKSGTDFAFPTQTLYLTRDTLPGAAEGPTTAQSF
jgi:MscS family membrane protein